MGLRVLSEDLAALATGNLTTFARARAQLNAPHCLKTCFCQSLGLIAGPNQNHVVVDLVNMFHLCIPLLFSTPCVLMMCGLDYPYGFMAL